MANRTPNPSNFFDKLREMEYRLNLRIDNRAGFDASQLNRTVAKLEELVAGLLTQVNGIFSGYVSAAGSVTAGTTITAGGNFVSTGGTLVSPYARSHSVVSSYVAAYIDGGGNILSTPSTAKLKRDVATATWTAEQRAQIRIVYYRLRAAYILADINGSPEDAEVLTGVIGEELIAAGFPEFVVLDSRGRVFTVRYELLALIALDGIQQIDRELSELRQELGELRSLIADGRKA